MLKIRTEFTDQYIKNPQAKSPPDIPSTVKNPSDSFGTEKRKPGLVGPGFGVSEEETMDRVATSTVPYSAISDNANNFLAAEARVSYNAGYIKLMREAEELLIEDPDAFLLLTYIAFRANRQPKKHNRLDIGVGECLIKGCDSVGLTRQRYRDAVRALSAVHQKATFRKTNRGLIAKLTSSDIYDINPVGKEPSEKPPENHQRTISTLYTERSKEVKKEEKNKKKGTRKTALPVVSADASRLFSLFLETLKKTLPDLKPPKNLKAWESEFVAILEKDERSVEQVEKAILSLPGHFYSPNVCSAKKFRKEFHRFTLQKPASSSQEVTLVEKRVKGSYTVDYKDGFIILISKQNYPVAKFAKTDREGIDRWLKTKGI